MTKKYILQSRVFMEHASFAEEMGTWKNGDSVSLVINSPGGDAVAGMVLCQAALSALERGVEINMVVLGQAHSAAAALAMCGSKPPVLSKGGRLSLHSSRRWVKEQMLTTADINSMAEAHNEIDGQMKAIIGRWVKDEALLDECVSAHGKSFNCETGLKAGVISGVISSDVQIVGAAGDLPEEVTGQLEQTGEASALSEQILALSQQVAKLQTAVAESNRQDTDLFNFEGVNIENEDAGKTELEKQGLSQETIENIGALVAMLDKKGGAIA